MLEYKGFMYIECPHCKEIKAFCAKEPMNYYRCHNCQEKMDLVDLKRLHLNCECGKYSRYWTNMTDHAFDVECIECSSPMPVKYNEKKDIYETIR